MEDVSMYYRIILGLFCALLLGSAAFADNGFKEGGKEVGPGNRQGLQGSR